MPASRPAEPPCIGYIASHYPAVSHSFVLREVSALRRLGVALRTISIWRTKPEELLSDADRQAAATTFAALPIAPLRLLGAHARNLARGPWRYVSTLLRALRLSAPGARAHLWQLFYFAEAIVVFEHCLHSGIRHLHAQFADSATDVALLVSHRGGSGWSWSLAVHGPVEFYNVEGYRLPAKLTDATFVQAISHFGRSQLLTLLEEDRWDKVHVVHCGVDPEVYLPQGPPPHADGELRILCVGRLVNLKGQSLLVRAASRLRERGVDVRVVLIGDGPKRRELERLARELGVDDRVELLGSVGQAEIRNYYEAADLFCLPSFAEGVPVVLMEAMALERPVVTSMIMGIPELVEDGVSGLVVPPGDLDRLVAALERLAGDPQLRARMGRAGRAKVLAEFDVRASALRLRELFAEVLPSAAPRSGTVGDQALPDAGQSAPSVSAG
jgi:glycosyltransferase involved in cell wall biosynthesis